MVYPFGAQIRIIDGGAGMEKAKEMAVTLEKKGMTVTQVAPTPIPTVGTVVLFKGDLGREAESKIKEFISFRNPEDIQRSGWTITWYDLILYMGTSTCPRPQYVRNDRRPSVWLYREPEEKRRHRVRELSSCERVCELGRDKDTWVNVQTNDVKRGWIRSYELDNGNECLGNGARSR